MRRLLAVAALVAAFLIVAPLMARAQNVPRGLGHPDGPVHWYDTACCSMQDCEPVELGAIQRQDEGYYIEFLSARGFLVRGFVPLDSPAIHPSLDGREHVCATAQKILCIYLPLNS